MIPFMKASSVSAIIHAHLEQFANVSPSRKNQTNQGIEQRKKRKKRTDHIIFAIDVGPLLKTILLQSKCT